MDQNGTRKPPSLNATRMMRQQQETKDRNIRQLFDDRGQLEEALATNWNDLLHVGYNPPMTPKTHFTMEELKEQIDNDGRVIVLKARLYILEESEKASAQKVRNLSSELSYQVELNRKMLEVNKALKKKARKK